MDSWHPAGRLLVPPWGWPPTVHSVKEETLPRRSLEAIALGHTSASEGALRDVILLIPFVFLRVMGTQGERHPWKNRAPWRRCFPLSQVSCAGRVSCAEG